MSKWDFRVGDTVTDGTVIGTVVRFEPEGYVTIRTKNKYRTIFGGNLKKTDDN